MQLHFILQPKLDLRLSSSFKDSRKPEFQISQITQTILKDGFLKFLIAISFKHFSAEDLGMDAEPIRPHQRKELPSNLGLTQMTLVAYILRLSQYSQIAQNSISSQRTCRKLTIYRLNLPCQYSRKHSHILPITIEPASIQLPPYGQR